MQNVCQITFCQQIGKNKKHNQDALFNGETVFQFKLKTAEKRVENRPHFIIGIADGISNSNHAEKYRTVGIALPTPSSITTKFGTHLIHCSKEVRFKS